MKKRKLLSNFKKILIIVVCFIALLFCMPTKSKANVLGDFFDLILRVPDALMWATTRFLSSTPTAVTSYELNLKGVKWGDGEEGHIYNFPLTPYSIFSTGNIKTYYTYEPEGYRGSFIQQLNSGTNSNSVIVTNPIVKTWLLPVDQIAKFVTNTITDFSIEGSKMQENESGKYVNNPVFDANFFSEYKYNKETKTYTKTDSDGEEIELTYNTTNAAAIMRPVIANVYKATRNLAIIVMMLVLLYIGIRIILASTSAGEKAKYKNLLIDWLVGFCLLFIMHYIMSSIMNLNEKVVSMISNDDGDTYYILLAEQGNGTSEGTDWKEVLKNPKYWTFSDMHLEIDMDYTARNYQSYDLKYDEKGRLYVQPFVRKSWNRKIKDENGKKIDGVYVNARIFQASDETSDDGTASSENDKTSQPDVALYRCNLMEYVRVLSAFSGDCIRLYSNGSETLVSDQETGNSDVQAFAFGMLYLALVLETIMFCVIYIKRFFMLAFLTMIAPFVALMYPIDKVGDGKAQSFNKWFKDYLFNVLIQPLHLLIYTILINGAEELFSQNVLYAIGVYAFIVPAEKYFKDIFGFNKASNGGGAPFGGALGAGLAMGGLSKWAGIGPGPAPKGGSGKGSGDSGANRKIDKVKRKPSTEPGSSGIDNESGFRGRNVSENGNTFRANNARSRNNTNRTNNGNNTRQNDPGAIPNASGFRKKAAEMGKRASEFGNAGARIAGRRILKAATGGRYSQPSDIYGKTTGRRLMKAAGAVAGNIGKHGSRIVGAGLGASAGLMVGGATAMVTGDINKVIQGTGIGYNAGKKQVGNIYDYVTGAGSAFVGDVKDLVSEENEDYRKSLRVEQAYNEFKDEKLTDGLQQTMETFAPEIDFGGNVKLLDKVDERYNELQNEGYTEEEAYFQTLEEINDSKNRADLEIESNRNSYIDAVQANILDDINNNKIKTNISESDIENRAIQNKTKEFEKQKAEDMEKLDNIEDKYSIPISLASLRKDDEEIERLTKKKDNEKRKLEARVNAPMGPVNDEDRAKAKQDLNSEWSRKKAMEQANVVRKMQGTLKKK